MNLVEASGLTADEFPKVQKGVVTLRNNLIKAAQGRADGQVTGSPSPKRP